MLPPVPASSLGTPRHLHSKTFHAIRAYSCVCFLGSGREFNVFLTLSLPQPYTHSTTNAKLPSISYVMLLFLSSPSASASHSLSLEATLSMGLFIMMEKLLFVTCHNLARHIYKVSVESNERFLHSRSYLFHTRSVAWIKNTRHVHFCFIFFSCSRL